MLCTESETGNNDGSVLSMHPEHIWHHLVRSVCVGSWNGWMVGVFDHHVNVLRMCKCRTFVSDAKTEHVMNSSITLIYSTRCAIYKLLFFFVIEPG